MWHKYEYVAVGSHSESSMVFRKRDWASSFHVDRTQLASYLVNKRNMVLEHHLVLSAHLAGAAALFNKASHC